MEKCISNTTSLDVHVIEEELKERPFRTWTKEITLFDYNKNYSPSYVMLPTWRSSWKTHFAKKNNRGMMGDMHNMDGLRFSRQTKIIFQIETKISRINGKNDGGFNIFQCKYNWKLLMQKRNLEIIENEWIGSY